MASPQQHPIEQTAISGFRTLFGGVSSVSRKAQAIVGEFAKLSEAQLGAGAKAAERLRYAQSLQEVTTIQSELLKESYEATTNHYRKIAELAISTPQELAESAREFASTMAQAGQEGAERASEMTHRMGEKAAQANDETGDAAQSAMRGGDRG
ncbi:hypothetical protein GJ654_03860 [Rhodoblastus acidophilus]|uniref:Phasin domain-containing protein n=1 Tax=Rhodoblastus acidophilus TaxID=1074 RepID=A0A6N8DJV0_RHOAC|nr:phasin family protein [Rhodoblastus acidophilus]MCW2273230.1 hypothetical protein [Rhodoblastus acidophilus]MTV30126.1 hypothetical protein [Rhodoblastus acidophilus]